jgi:DivIVA domain-containing protein
MDFPNTFAGVLGYDPKAVDALMARVKRQYEDQGLDLISAGMLVETRFDLVGGGYQVLAVDAALARLADTFELKEQSERLARLGKLIILSELEKMNIEVQRVLELGAVGAFDYAKRGYNKRDVTKALKMISAFDGLDKVDSFVVRSQVLRKSRSGLDRDQVDEFLALVTAAATRARITA